MTDQEIVDGLINRDEKITDWFFNIKYRPLFINVIKLIFDYQVDYDECISELYYHLMKNDAAVLAYIQLNDFCTGNLSGILYFARNFD